MFSKYVLHAFHGAHAFFTHGPCQDNGACRLNATVLDAADDRKDLSHRPGIVAHGRPIKNIALPPAIHDSAQGVHRIQVGFQQQSGGTGRPGKRSQHISCMVDRGIFQAFVHQHGTEKLCLLLLVEGRCRGFGKLELLRQSSFGIGLGISQGSKNSFVSKKGIYGCTYLAVDGVVFHTGLLLIF